jgi:maltose 6'-phosphate phosphatase
MLPSKDGWWQANIPTNNTTVAFNCNGQWDSLGGVMGNYPKDPEEFYRLSGDENWIKNSLVYSHHPDQPDDNEFTLLTINLHTYQEIQPLDVSDESHVENYQPILEKIAQGINALQPDVVCLQEVGEPLDSEKPFGESGLNLAQQIMQKLTQKMNWAGDWSHVGFGRWREGEMILTPHTIIETDSKYITDSKAKDFVKSRNVVRARIDIPNVGIVNVCSAHTGWFDDTEEPFQRQFERLHDWMFATGDIDDIRLIGGDLNVNAGSPGYRLCTQQRQWQDLYLQALPTGLNDNTIGKGISGWQGSTTGKRLDYILTPSPGLVTATAAQRIFTEHCFGRVSDHTGVYVRAVSVPQ